MEDAESVNPAVTLSDGGGRACRNSSTSTDATSIASLHERLIGTLAPGHLPQRIAAKLRPQ